jgi:hypothetical protein
MIENWIDEVAKVWEISDGFKTVQSFKLVEKAEFPESIDPTSLDNAPIALTIPASVGPEYSLGGPHIGYWIGVTEFHVASNQDRGKLPELLPWYRKIINAAASHMKLNNTVELFLIDEGNDAITGPVPLQFGDETPHWGFLVRWRVKERLEGQITVSA